MEVLYDGKCYRVQYEDGTYHIIARSALYRVGTHKSSQGSGCILSDTPVIHYALPVYSTVQSQNNTLHFNTYLDTTRSCYG